MSDAGSNAPGIGQATKDQRAEDLARAKAAGWADPIPFDYVPAAPSGEGSGDHASPAWLSDAVVYAWDDDFGDVGPANPELEKALFGDDNLQRAGGAIEALSFHVDITGPDKVLPVRTVSLQRLTSKVTCAKKIQFEAAGLHPIMAENVKLCQYDHPTPIQAFCIPAVLSGHDVVGIAQTGMSFQHPLLH
jgi:ATP-dependent RNA helicase DDX3X